MRQLSAQIGRRPTPRQDVTVQARQLGQHPGIGAVDALQHRALTRLHQTTPLVRGAGKTPMRIVVNGTLRVITPAYYDFRDAAVRPQGHRHGTAMRWRRVTASWARAVTRTAGPVARG